MITHLKERYEFYGLCLEHGEENVEWRYRSGDGFTNNWSGWQPAPNLVFGGENSYEFRLRPKTVRIPEAEVPSSEHNMTHFWITVQPGQGDHPIYGGEQLYYRTAEDRDKVVAAMLARKLRHE